MGLLYGFGQLAHEADGCGLPQENNTSQPSLGDARKTLADSVWKSLLGGARKINHVTMMSDALCS